jgi:pyruvate formate lyase activating enzyme
MGYVARHWEKTEDNCIVCNLCPRHCKLKEGQRGMCFVRSNIGGKMKLTTYGRSSGFCIDPIEKKPLNHFLPGTPVLSFGTAGCNLTCKFCQNSSISRAKEAYKLNEIAMPVDIAKTAKKLNCRSVAYTYNEPLIFLEYAVDVAKECKEQGIKNVAVTAGYVEPEARKDFFDHMDAVNIDLKAFSNCFYEKMCSVELDPILDTLKYVKNETNVWTEITNLIIPGKNDSDTEIDAMTSWIVENLGQRVPIHFSAFHPAYKLTEIKRTPIETLERARQIAIKNGIKYVYTGNVDDKKNASTYCPECNKMIIERNFYEIGEVNMTKDGHCKFCNAKCDGVFEENVGNWGRNSILVKLK